MSDQLALFDYAQLEPEVRAVAIEAAVKIRMHGRRAAESIVAIGEELARVKAALPHGAWLPWMEAEFGWSEDTAGRFLQVARLREQIPQIAEYPIDVSALYLLARPSTPEPVREAAIERAAAGERVTHASVKSDLADLQRRLAEQFPAEGPVHYPPPLPVEPDPEAQRVFRLEADLGGSFRDNAVRLQ